MPVRKIPKNHLVVTGSFASRKNGQMDAFASLLEKEYMLLLEFDERILRFEPQPVTIAVPGIPKGYIPDVLVHYHLDPLSGEIPKSILTEVKHTDDLQRNAQKYAPKFAVAEEYASERGWEFRISADGSESIRFFQIVFSVRSGKRAESHAGRGCLVSLFEASFSMSC